MSFFFPLNRTCIGTYSVRIVLFGLGKEKRREERVLQYTPDWEQRKKKIFFSGVRTFISHRQNIFKQYIYFAQQKHAQQQQRSW